MFAHDARQTAQAFLTVGIAAQLLGAFEESLQTLQWTVPLAEEGGDLEVKAMAFGRLDLQRQMASR